MRTSLSRLLPWLIGIVALMATIALAWILLAGSAVVIDETGGVETAVIVNGGAEQKLHRLWNGYFYAMPKFDGTIEIRCRSGLRKQAGYVTGGLHTRVRVVGKTPCEGLIET